MMQKPTEKPPKRLRLISVKSKTVHCGRLSEIAENGVVYCPMCGNTIAATSKWQIELIQVQPGTACYDKAQALLRRIDT